jgi:hypothetical protein
LAFLYVRVRQSAIGKTLKLDKIFPDFSRGLTVEIQLSVGAFLFGQGEILGLKIYMDIIPAVYAYSVIREGFGK